MSAKKKASAGSQSRNESLSGGGAAAGKADDGKKAVVQSDLKKGFLQQDQVLQELKQMYYAKVLPIEQKSLFSKFHHPELLESEFNAKPTILLVGQYSVGKTSFIRQLIGMDYPDINIGPEPTTE
jgi:N-terminal EH-domain containing protein